MWDSLLYTAKKSKIYKLQKTHEVAEELLELFTGKGVREYISTKHEARTCKRWHVTGASAERNIKLRLHGRPSCSSLHQLALRSTRSAVATGQCAETVRCAVVTTESMCACDAAAYNSFISMSSWIRSQRSKVTLEFGWKLAKIRLA